MKRSTFRCVAALTSVVFFSAAAAADESSAASAPTVSPDLMKRAKDVGLKPETRKGEQVYCWEDQDVGTRFKTKKCVNNDGLANLVQQREEQKQALRNHIQNGGNAH
jgi:hypothetical protein